MLQIKYGYYVAMLQAKLFKQSDYSVILWADLSNSTTKMKKGILQRHFLTVKVHHPIMCSESHSVILGGSRKYPYPYHGRHLGIPKGRGG